MTVLPDYLAPRLRIVFCGTAAGERSAERQRYYAGPGNRFWEYLHESGLTPVRLWPEDDERITDFDLGLTDLVKTVAASSDAGLRDLYGVARFVEKIERYAPSWVAFHGKQAAQQVRGSRTVKYGAQPWPVASARVFVVPSASASNNEPRDRIKRLRRLEGRENRLEWFSELARVAGVVQ